jgi:hypothetical protein
MTRKIKLETILGQFFGLWMVLGFFAICCLVACFEASPKQYRELNALQQKHIGIAVLVKDAMTNGWVSGWEYESIRVSAINQQVEREMELAKAALKVRS